MSDLNADPIEAGQKRAVSGGRVNMLSGKRCLVVEDERVIALDIQQELEAAGAVVVCTATLEEAVAALRGPRFDLGLLDLRLGSEETSLPVARVLEDAGTPFIFLTAAPGDTAGIAVFGRPVLEKPFLPHALIAVVQEALGRGD